MHEIFLVPLFFLYNHVFSYRTYTALNAVVFTNIDDPSADVHSEYYFGRCATRYKTLHFHDHLTYEDIKGKMILRGWLNTSTEPNCVYIRARSPYGRLVRYEAFKFGLCICEITYSYINSKYIYYYYEWYIPVTMKEGIDWDLYFYVA